MPQSSMRKPKAIFVVKLGVVDTAATRQRAGALRPSGDDEQLRWVPGYCFGNTNTNDSCPLKGSTHGYKCRTYHSDHQLVFPITERVLADQVPDPSWTHFNSVLAMDCRLIDSDFCWSAYVAWYPWQRRHHYRFREWLTIFTGGSVGVFAAILELVNALDAAVPRPALVLAAFKSSAFRLAGVV